jgi:hypothetical protein
MRCKQRRYRCHEVVLNISPSDYQTQHQVCHVGRAGGLHPFTVCSANVTECGFLWGEKLCNYVKLL